MKHCNKHPSKSKVTLFLSRTKLILLAEISPGKGNQVQAVTWIPELNL